MKTLTFLTFFACLFSCAMENKTEFAAIDFDFAFDLNNPQNDYIFCNTVHTPLALRITNIFPYPVGIVKYAEKASSCLDHLSEIKYQIDEKEEVFGFSSVSAP